MEFELSPSKNKTSGTVRFKGAYSTKKRARIVFLGVYTYFDHLMIGF
jgi:hypothetical protein